MSREADGELAAGAAGGQVKGWGCGGREGGGLRGGVVCGWIGAGADAGGWGRMEDGEGSEGGVGY